ncbi:MAG: heme lyase CcmF/NrfE family subunit, partial [Actinobacteria bacterium]|nr:heme lyase CcmF/NrfE family subunit [Actinomycetota bacterium]
MAVFGRAVLFLALIAALAAIVLALGSRRPGRRAWRSSADRAVYALAALTTVAIGTLWAGFFGDRFDLRAVAESSNRTQELRFKVSALWAGEAGSLLFWVWILSLYAALAVFVNRGRNRELMPVVVAVLMGVALAFIGILNFVTSPFEKTSGLAAGADGFGLNPLLQNPYMVTHPVFLYLGYVGLTVPFAFAMAALVTRRLDTHWIVSVRRWTILAWLFLGVGILVGSRWAYEELGWGGYWAWDPVENAAFMPWLVATAFLHSVMVQERRGMLKVWNMALVTMTFVLSLFGTFLTRSGIITSIHAFGASTVGPYFLAIIIVVAVGATVLIISRLPALRSEHGLESYVSREGIFLFNNLLLVGLAASVFWGTMFPIVSETFASRRIVVGQGYFNQIALPIGVALLILTGVGPLIPWRKASLAQLRRRFVVPLSVAAVAAVALLATPAWESWAAGLVFTAAAFVTASLVGEFWRGTRTRHRLGGVSYPGAAVQLVAGNRRRYGGYLVHLGIVVLFVGFAGSQSFSTDGILSLAPGASGRVGKYVVVNECTAGVRGAPDPCPSVRTANLGSRTVKLGVFDGGERVATLTPGRSFYFASQQNTTEASISSRLVCCCLAATAAAFVTSASLPRARTRAPRASRLASRRRPRRAG